MYIGGDQVRDDDSVHDGKEVTRFPGKKVNTYVFSRTRRYDAIFRADK